jgi:hypothetical protein
MHDLRADGRAAQSLPAPVGTMLVHHLHDNQVGL